MTGTAGSLRVADSRKLFEVRASFGRTTIVPGPSVSSDGRFLVNLLDPRAVPTQINVVLDWFDELQAKVPRR